MSLEEKWTDEAYRVLSVHEKVLALIGIWPLNAETLGSLTGWSVSTIGNLTLEIYRHCVEADETMDAFLMDLSSVVSLSKLLMMRLRRGYTRILANAVIEDWAGVTEPRDRRIMRRYSERGRSVSLTILYLGYASGLSFVLRALSTYAWTSPWLDRLPGRTNESARTVYFLASYCVYGPLAGTLHKCVLALQAVQIFVNATSHCANDGFFFVLTMHLCGQFQVLQRDISEIRPGGGSACRQRFGALIARHRRLAFLADSLEHTFNAIILVQLLMSALLLGLEGFQLLLSLKLKDNLVAAKHAVLIVTMLAQLYLYAYAGDAMESHTEKIGCAAYDCRWYDFDARIAKDLPFVILRGATPHQITAGKFCPMNLFTFKEILKTSASYLSVLGAMMDA
ncbi:hypothetical protein KM043_006101 [Ampulex compressa]|nr:hypothetical protein KM043_006101 [Ampulex compressa]